MNIEIRNVLDEWFVPSGKLCAFIAVSPAWLFWEETTYELMLAGF